MEVFEVIQVRMHSDVSAIKKGILVKKMSQREPIMVEIEIPLSLHPDSNWIDSFKNLSETVPGFHPKAVIFSGDKMSFTAEERFVQDNVGQIHKYIAQTNESYKKRMAEMGKRQATEAERQTKLQQKMSDLTEKLRKL